MRSQNIIIGVLLSASIYSCQHTAKGTLQYDQLKYDTNMISIFKWDTTKDVFPNNSDPLPLTQDDLALIDSLVKDAIDTFNKTSAPGYVQDFDKKVSIDSFIISQAKYRFQFFPYRDVNGQRIVYIVGFTNDFNAWKSEIYHGRNHNGMHNIEIKLNLSDRTRSEIQNGGFG